MRSSLERAVLRCQAAQTTARALTAAGIAVAVLGAVAVGLVWLFWSAFRQEAPTSERNPLPPRVQRFFRSFASITAWAAGTLVCVYLLWRASAVYDLWQIRTEALGTAKSYISVRWGSGEPGWFRTLVRLGLKEEAVRLATEHGNNALALLEIAGSLSGDEKTRYFEQAKSTILEGVDNGSLPGYLLPKIIQLVPMGQKEAVLSSMSERARRSGEKRGNEYVAEWSDATLEAVRRSGFGPADAQSARVEDATGERHCAELIRNGAVDQCLALGPPKRFYWDDGNLFALAGAKLIEKGETRRGKDLIRRALSGDDVFPPQVEGLEAIARAGYCREAREASNRLTYREQDGEYVNRYTEKERIEIYNAVAANCGGWRRPLIRFANWLADR